MKADDATVGTRVRSRRDFAGVDAGTEGVIDEDYGAGVMVAWDLEDRPLPDGYADRLPIEPGDRPMTTRPQGFETLVLRDGFGWDELEHLEVVDDDQEEGDA